MSYHRRLNQSLVIDKLISITGLNLAIQYQTLTEGTTTNKLGGLELRLPGIQNPFDTVQLN